VLLVRRPVDEPPSKAYYLEITLPDETRSVAEYGPVQDVAGETGLLPAVLQ